MDSPESKTILFVARHKDDCKLAKEQLGNRILVAKDFFDGAEFMKHKGSDLLLMDASDYFGGEYEKKIGITRRHVSSFWKGALKAGMVKKAAIILEMGEYWATMLVATEGKEHFTLVASRSFRFITLDTEMQPPPEKPVFKEDHVKFEHFSDAFAEMFKVNGRQSLLYKDRGEKMVVEKNYALIVRQIDRPISCPQKETVSPSQTTP